MKAITCNWITLVFQLSTVITAMQLNGTLQVTHEQNLIWAQRNDKSKVSRLVGVSGDPNKWIPSHVASSRHITAPKSSWKFVALTFNYHHQQLFWSDSGNNRIQGYYLNGSTEPFDIQTGTSNQVAGIAVDWLRGNLYWCDAVYNWIGMAVTTPARDYGAGFHKIIVDTGLDKPHDIVVDPLQRKLFWSDTGVVAKIETSDLTGLNRKMLVYTGLSQPTGLSYDIDSKTLYWIDRSLHRVESISSDGKNRRILIEEKAGLNFRAITTYGDYIFITEQDQQQLIVYQKSSGEREISFSMNGATPYDVIMYDPSSQPSAKVNCHVDTCDHMCTETGSGQVMCVCSEGYRLHRNGRKCVVHRNIQPPKIIYTIGAAICTFPANIPDISIETISLDKYCILTEQNTTALAVGVKEQVLFLYDSFTSSISKVRLMNGQSKLLNTLTNVGHVTSMSYDWVAMNLYWIDEVNNRIMIINHEGDALVTLLDDLDSPQALAVDAVNRKLYWSVVGTHPMIEISQLDGSDRRGLITKDVMDPSHLTVDYVSYRLYWCDTKLGRIEWSSFDGAIRRLIMDQPESSFSGLTVFQDFVLWTETGSSNGLHVAYKGTGQKIRGVIHPKVGQAGPVITYDKSSQPTVAENPCDQHNCHQVCIPVDRVNFTCRCGLGYVREKSGYSCSTEHFSDNFLVFTEHFHQAIYQLSLDTNQIRTLPIPNLGHPHALTFDSKQQRLYWTDMTYKLIKTARLDGTDEKVVALLNKDSVPDGIAVASQSGLVYYTDGGSRLIGVIDTLGGHHMTLIKHRLNKPRGIAVYEEKGLLFWTDWGRRSRIERADMSGGSRKQIVSTGTGAWPNGLTIDRVSERLYWCDARQRLVETSDFDGQHRRILARIPQSHIFAVTLLDGSLYYSDWKKRSVMQMKVRGQKATVQTIGPADFNKINGIDSYRKADTEEVPGNSPCEDMPKKCSHICIPVTTRTFCRCPDGIQMSKDGLTCFTEKWLTNAAPFIIPTPNTPTEESIRNHVTTKPSLLNKYSQSGNRPDVPVITNGTNTDDENLQTQTVNNKKDFKGITIRPNGKVEEQLSKTYSTRTNISDNMPSQDTNEDVQFENYRNIEEKQAEELHTEEGVYFTIPPREDSTADSITIQEGRRNDNDGIVTTNAMDDVSVATTMDSDSLDLNSEDSKMEEDGSHIEPDNMLHLSEERLDQANTNISNKGNPSGIFTIMATKSKNASVQMNTTKVSSTTIFGDIVSINTFESPVGSNAYLESLNASTKNKELDSAKQKKVPAVIALNNTNKIFRIKTIIPDEETKKLTTTSNNILSSTTEDRQPDLDESLVFSGTTKTEMLGLLLAVCVAAILVCASLTCCVLCYNKMLKKKKSGSSTDLNSLQQEREMTKTLNSNHFDLAASKKVHTIHIPAQKIPSPLYASPNLNNNINNRTAKIATIRIKTSGRQNHYSKSAKVFATEVTKKYASMSDSQFTGEPDSRYQPNALNHLDNFSYQPDSGSDFSFDTDVDSNNVPDFVTFKYGHDSHV